MKTQDLSAIMRQAWQFVRITGLSIRECLKKAWANFKLKKQMQQGIVKFYFQKVDGTIREAWGTLKADLLPLTVEAVNKRKSNDVVFTYFDTEKQEYRCFKKFNLITEKSYQTKLHATIIDYKK